MKRINYKIVQCITVIEDKKSQSWCKNRGQGKEAKDNDHSQPKADKRHIEQHVVHKEHSTWWRHRKWCFFSSVPPPVIPVRLFGFKHSSTCEHECMKEYLKSMAKCNEISSIQNGKKSSIYGVVMILTCSPTWANSKLY